MTVTFNHTIVYATDKRRSAEFLATVLGLPKPQAMWSFMTVPLDHGVALDFATADRSISPQHYAFLVSEEDFDGIFARIQAQGIPYWADPGRSRPQQINHNDGGRGIYFTDPDGHLLEAITRPYGSGADEILRTTLTTALSNSPYLPGAAAPPPMPIGGSG